MKIRHKAKEKPMRDRTLETLWAEFDPRDKKSVWKWAEENVILSKRVTENPGPYRSEWCPYVRAPQEDFTNPDVRDIVLCWATRTSKTETFLNCIRYSIAGEPQAWMLAISNDKQGKSLSETRLQPSIDESPTLSKEKPTNIDKYKLTEMHFKRCTGWIVGSNSPANLSQRGVTILVCDEIDKWPGASKKEAGALELVMERTKDRRNRKHLLSSTPTIDSGQIWKEFKLGDQRYYFVPCPHCGEMQTFKMKQIRWSEDAKFEEGWDFAKVRQTAFYECEKCEGQIQDGHKPDMLRRGQWRPTASGKEPQRRSYHLNAIYPEWITFADIAVKFLESKGDAEKFQGFVNSWLAEPFYAYGDTVDQEARLLEMRDKEAPETVPEGYKAIVFCDVQRDRIYFVARAHAKNRDSRQLAYGCVPGLEEVEVAVSKFEPAAIFVDARYRTRDILEWCATHHGWIATMGAAGLMTPIRWVKMPIDGGLLKGQEVRTIRFRPDDFRQMLHDRMNRDKATEAMRDQIPNWSVLPDISDEYKRQVVANRRVERKGPRGRVIVEFIQVGADHYNDCETGNIMGFESIRAYIFDVKQTDMAPPPMPARSREEQDVDSVRQQYREDRGTDRDDVWGGSQDLN